MEQIVAGLARLDPASPDAVDMVRMALRLKACPGFVVAAAAKAVGTHAMRDAVPELVAAFDALYLAKRDPGCSGRLAIVIALHALDHWAAEVFERGLTLVQLEGDPNNRFDYGAAVRGACAQAHVHLLRADALDVCAEMLADAWAPARIGAARGLGESGRVDATATLRFKLALGPDDSEVMAACFDGLFELRRDPAIDFSIAMLKHQDERAEGAALALGSQRAAEATDALIAWCGGAPKASRHRVGYLALALLRSDAANSALATVIRTGAADDALAAGEALATFKHEPAVHALLLACAKATKHEQLRAELEKLC
ncbi:hypothetical protein BH11MYX1_BH11MYX1_16590 [soil metagenome]